MNHKRKFAYRTSFILSSIYFMYNTVHYGVDCILFFLTMFDMEQQASSLSKSGSSNWVQVTWLLPWARILWYTWWWNQSRVVIPCHLDFRFLRPIIEGYHYVFGVLPIILNRVFLIWLFLFNHWQVQNFISFWSSYLSLMIQSSNHQ